jgi:hypothetical protein
MPRNKEGFGRIAANFLARTTGSTLGLAVLQDVFAGVISNILSITYGFSFAALIFSGPLTGWLAYGIAATELGLI